MDIACTPSVRNAFLAALQHPSFLLKGHGPDLKTRIANYMNWLNARQAQIEQVKLRHCPARAQSALDAHVLQNAKVIEIDGSGCNVMQACVQSAFLKVFAKCSAVSRIFSTDQSAWMRHCIPLIEQFPHWPLKSIECALSNESVQRIVQVFRGSLEELVINGRLDESIATAAIVQCQCISKLAFPKHSLSCSDLRILLDGLPRLRDLSFFTHCDHLDHSISGKDRMQKLAISDIPQLAPCLSKLQRLSFYLSRDGGRSFAAILAACPAMQYLDMDVAKYYQCKWWCSLALTWMGSKPNSTDDHDQIVCDCLRACPVPILELEVTTYWPL